MENEISIVVFANAKDYFFTKICIASIRYFYPDIEISLVKDELNGKFSTRTLEKRFNVKKIRLSQRYFGWAAAKIHFLVERNENKKYLCLDSDIIFAGLVLNNFNNIEADVIVSPDFCEKPIPKEIEKNYFNLSEIENEYQNYEYPGYFFNAGQTLINPSKFSNLDFVELFNAKKYPYYLSTEVFPLVDQSILNYLFPKLNNEGRIKLIGIEFMKWSVNYFLNPNSNSIEILENKENFLIHYAGDHRVIHLDQMKGSVLLKFYQNCFFARLNYLEILLSKFQDSLNASNTILKSSYLINVLKMKFLNNGFNQS
jgi:hypothetical protein